MPDGQILVGDYSDSGIQDLLGRNYSSEYLCSYLRDLSVAGWLLESHYVDRHYLADYSTYYSRSFNAPPTACQRLHLFSVSAAELQDNLESAYNGIHSRNEAEARLEQSYLGFVVIRPLAAAKMGRTVLKTYPEDGRRRYQVVRPYVVNLAGLRLEIKGLAYQQQDRGAAVCASTAPWSALQRVAYVAGHRSPTPSAITAASRSPFPASHGLHEAEMATALASLGYVADQFAPAENRALFRAMIVACLESQLPVVITMSTTIETGAGHVDIGHAVTITGYKEATAIGDVPPQAKGGRPIRMKSAHIEVVYVHDDNLGSHAHYELHDSDEVDANGHRKLMLKRGRTDRPQSTSWAVDEWCVVSALVPKPEKLRMPIDSLFGDIVHLRMLCEQIFQDIDVHYGARFCSGVAYKRSLFDHHFSNFELSDFQRRASLPRHIGVITVSHGDVLLCDLVLDVSEVPRQVDQPSMIGIVAPGVPVNSPAWAYLVRVAAYFACPLLAAPPTP